VAAPATAQSVDKVIFADGLGTRTTAAFSTSSPNEVLVAFVGADGAQAGGQTVTVSGAGLTWTLARRVNVRAGTSEIWVANAAAILTNVTVTSTETQSGFYQSLTVVTFSGAAGIGAVAGASGASGATTVQLTTTQAGSLVYGVGDDWDTATARTLGANQAMVHQYLAPVGDTFWVQNRIGTVPAAGTPVQLNDTAPTNDQWNFAAVEIVAAATPPGFSISTFTNSLTAGRSDFVTYNMAVAPINGFTGPLACGVSNVPANTTASMEPAGGLPHPGPIALNITTSATTPPGTYQPTVTCTAGSVVAVRNVTLVVTDLPDFRVGLKPNRRPLAQGQTGVANYTIEAMNSYVQGVNMSAGGLPSGVAPTFSPAQLIPTGVGTMQLAVGSAATPGVSSLAVTATAVDASLARQAAFSLTVLPSNSSGTWRQQPLGNTPARFYGVIAGDPGNTGKTRVFGSGGNGLVYEYSFNGTSWSSTLVPFGVAGDGPMHDGTIGPGRNDGTNRLYVAASLSGRVYEASWVAGAWQTAVITTLAGATDVVIADGRNSGTMRAYVTSQAGVTELTWNGSSWTPTVVGSEAGEVHGLDIGPGRNDGINRIYAANDRNGQVSEYSWNGSVWSRILMGTHVDARSVRLGDGRNTGALRAYVASADGNIYEHNWNGSAWQNVSIGDAGVTGIKTHAVPLKVKGDNITRIYVSAADGGVYELAWSGSAWQAVWLGSATAYMYGLGAGDGLGQGSTQIYGGSYDGNVYLFEWVPAPPVLVNVPNVVGQVQAAAQTAITAAQLVVGTITSQPSFTVPSGSVSSQNPIGGTQAQIGSPVNLVISTGLPIVSVPSIVNMPQTTAASTVVAATLVVGAVTNAVSATVAAGAVISQNPIAGTQILSGSAVAFVLSTGPAAPTITSLSPTSGVPGTVVTVSGTNLGTSPASTLLTGKIGWWGPFKPGVAPDNKVPGMPNGVFVGTPAFSADGGGGFTSTSTDYLRIPDGGAGGTYDWTAGPWSAQVDFVFPLTPDWGDSDHVLLVSKGSFNLGTGWEIQINNAIFQGKYALFLESNRGVGSYTNTYGYLISPGEFHRALFVCDATGNGLWYVNGTGTAPTPCAPTTSGATDLIIGKYSDPPGEYVSTFPISRVQIWNRALTPAEAVTSTTTDPNSGAVTFNGTAATPTNWSPTSIVVPVPAGATTGGVVVTASDKASNAVTFTVPPPPSITTLAPTSGPVGTAVTISGANFGTTQGTSTVRFNGTLATTSSWNGTTITATVPAGATTGNVVVTVGGRASNGVGFTVTAAPPSSLAVDKTVFSDGSGTRTTAAFSTVSADEVLVAFVAADGPTSGGTQTATVSGAGLTWTLVKRSNTQFGTAEIWTATAVNVLSNVTVTSTLGSSGFYQSLTVVTFTGASGVGASSIANAASGAPVISVTATKAGSFVYAVGSDWDNASARTVGGGQTMTHQYLAPVGDTFWVQRLTNPVAAPGVVQLNDTAPTADRWNLAAVEVVSK
jgi:hypothetical protein